VGHVGKQLPAGPVGRFEGLCACGEILRHAIERARHFRHFIAAALGRTRAEIPGSESDGRLLHTFEAPARRPEHDERNERAPDHQHHAAHQSHRRRKRAHQEGERRRSHRHRHGPGRDRPNDNRGELAATPPDTRSAIADLITVAGHAAQASTGTARRRSLGAGSLQPFDLRAQSPRELVGHGRLVRHRAAIAHEHDKGLEDVSVLIAHVLTEIEARLARERRAQV
jgi:hypothetical protein